MFIFLAILLSAVALFAVAYPILQRAGPSQSAAASAHETLDELLAQREAAFQALRELSFDHQVGKITDEDFAAFETNLKLHAADVLRALDRWEAEADAGLDDALEQAVRARRAALREPQDAALREPQDAALREPQDAALREPQDAALREPQDAALREPQDAALRGGACPACGSPAAAGDKFCPVCGAARQAPQPAASPACPRCGRPAEPVDRFCAGCGQALT